MQGRVVLRGPLPVPGLQPQPGKGEGGPLPVPSLQPQPGKGEGGPLRSERAACPRRGPHVTSPAQDKQTTLQIFKGDEHSREVPQVPSNPPRLSELGTRMIFKDR